MFLSLMTYLEPKGEGDRSMSGKQRPREVVEAGRCEARAIRQKLDCLKSNLQSVYVRARRNDVCNRCRSIRQHRSPADVTTLERDDAQ